MFLKDTPTMKNIEHNMFIIKEIYEWQKKYNNSGISTEDLLKDANEIFTKIISCNINIESLIIFDTELDKIKIKYLDTSDHIMLEAFNIFNKQAKCQENKLSHIINYVYCYLQHYAITKQEYNEKTISDICTIFNIDNISV